MRRSYKYRLYPTRQQSVALQKTLDTHRHLYNRALAERKEAWEQTRSRSVLVGCESSVGASDRL